MEKIDKLLTRLAAIATILSLILALINYPAIKCWLSKCEQKKEPTPDINCVNNQCSTTKAKKLKKYYKIGDEIDIGNWLYEANGIKHPITWVIVELDKLSDTGILISKGLIDAYSYHTYTGKDENIKWENSNIRKWLNGEFYNNAFSENEKLSIIKEFKENKNNQGKIDQKYIVQLKKWGLGYDFIQTYIEPTWDNPGGADTEDKIWLLSLEDIKKYSENSILSTQEARSLYPTPYMIKIKGKFCNTDYCKINEVEDKAGWWLRSPASSQNQVAYVLPDGFIDAVYGSSVYTDKLGIRPAMKINLKNL